MTFGYIIFILYVKHIALLGIRLLCIFGRAQNTFIMIFVCMHRGVSVDEKGYIYVADSGNNRIQIFNPDGTFLRCFGRWGQVNIFQSSRERESIFPCNMVPRVLKIIILKLQGEGEFKGLEGIAVNSKGNILVADRENHRVQIF